MLPTTTPPARHITLPKATILVVLFLAPAHLLVACSEPGPRTDAPAAGSLLGELGCGACHAGVPSAETARERAPPLGAAGRPMQPAFLLSYLRDPHAIRPDTGRSRMPDFHLDERESLALALFLSSEDPEGDGGEAAFRRVRQANPAVDAADGRRIFEALNCAGCHLHPDVEPRRNGPDLAREASRVRETWLREWLAAPSAVRPFGYPPGTGGRMPDFRLAPAEVDSITAFLLRASAEAAPPASEPRPEAPAGGGPETFEPRALSAYERVEAETLLRDRLSCLGCHRLGEDGGRIGPDLTRAGRRLRPAYLQGIIAEPGDAAPGTIMPRVPMTAERRHLIASYLAGGGDTARAGEEAREAARAGGESPGTERAGYLSLVDHPLTDPSIAAAGRGPEGPAGATGETLYRSRCAACHGAGGAGDGFNARYLPVAATAHAYAPYISTRPDATLYDGIHAGGRILNRSHRMPPFGESLEPAQIRSLVNHIRELCDCVGPAWSR